MRWLTAAAALAVTLASSALAIDTTSGTPVYTASKSFPTSLFPSMDYMPKRMEGEPRPHITREGGKGSYPDSLVNPRSLPTAPPKSETLQAQPHRGTADLDQLIKSVWEVASKLFKHDKASSLTCNLCRNVLDSLQKIARTDPDTIPDLAGSLCEAFNIFGLAGFHQECKRTLSKDVFGGAITQVLSYANFTDGAPDALTVCSQFSFARFCDRPDVSLSEDFLNDWFRGQRHAPKDVIDDWHSKRENAYKNYNPKDNLRVAHVSDLHLDPRYFVGGEADCTYGATVQCCRSNSVNFLKFQDHFVDGTLRDDQIMHKANYWGSLKCDTPWALLASSMEALKHVGGDNGYDIALFTGDLVALSLIHI